MTTLITGAAGFIGMHVAESLLVRGEPVVGIDNFTPYYSLYLKRARVEINLLPMQDGDVYQTFADIEDISRDLGFAPTTPMSVGVPAFVKWYLEEWSQHP